MLRFHVQKTKIILGCHVKPLSEPPWSQRSLPFSDFPQGNFEIRCMLRTYIPIESNWVK
jgi:hypothetical protein